MPALRSPTEKPNPSSLLFMRTISKKATTGWHARRTARGWCNICFSALTALSGFAVVRFSTPAASSVWACALGPQVQFSFRHLRTQHCSGFCGDKDVDLTASSGLTARPRCTGESLCGETLGWFTAAVSPTCWHAVCLPANAAFVSVIWKYNPFTLSLERVATKSYG